MVLFICSTPFQIINAINIALTKLKNEKADIYILDHSPDCYKYFNLLEGEKVFNRVYFLNTKDAYICNNVNKLVSILNYGKKAYNALNYKWLERKIPNRDTIYDNVFIAFPDLPTQILYYYHKKNNNAVVLSFYEDGAFTYSVFNRKWSWLRKKYSELIFGSYILGDCKKVYSYKPNFIKNKYHTFEKIAIPNFNKNNIFLLKLLNKLTELDIKTIEQFKYQYVFFQQTFQLDSIKSKQEQFLKTILQTVGREHLGLKLHPRNNESHTMECNLINSITAFEIIEINCNINNKVLISLFSTACLNPKILFNEEPYVILLYKLVKLTDMDENFFNIALDIERSYIDKERFFIPETVDELINILKFIESKIGKNKQ